MNPRPLHIGWFSRFAALAGGFLGAAALYVATAHPGSGIDIDGAGQVYFTDTGFGLWKWNPKQGLVPLPGEAWHWMQRDPTGKLAGKRFPRVHEGDLAAAGKNPVLVLSSSFPVAVGPDASCYFPEAREGEPVRIWRMEVSGRRRLFATLPRAMENGPGGKPIEARWVHGLAVGPRGDLFYTLQRSIHRITPDGKVTPLAAEVRVPEERRPSELAEPHLGPALRGLTVAADGSIYVAASASCALLKVSPEGAVSVVLRADPPWSPTGVITSGKTVYVLEYTHEVTTRREDWYPRVRKVSEEGSVETLVTVTEADRQRGRKLIP